MCSIWKNTKPADIDETHLLNAFRSSYLKDVKWITLTGGEPFLHKSLSGVIRTVIRTLPGLQGISIATNGLSGTIPAILDEILADTKSQGVSLNLSLSYDGIGEMHDQIRGVTGASMKVEENLRRILECKPAFSKLSVGISATVTRTNRLRLGDINQHFNSITDVNLRPDYVGFTPSTTSDYYRNRDAGDISLNRQELAEAADYLFDHVGTHPVFTYYYDCLRNYSDKGYRTFPCLGGYKSFYVDHALNLYPCHLLDNSFCLGNLLKSDIQNILNSPETTSILHALKSEKTCRSCLNNCDIRNLVTEETFNFVGFLARHPRTLGNILSNTNKFFATI